MHRLGISIYPEHSTEAKDYEYMKLAAKYGFTRIFTCLLSVEESREETINNFTDFISKAHSLGFKVSVDTNGEVFKFLGASAYDISVFAKMGVDIIRLDLPLTDQENIAITNNPYNIEIEFNASSDMSLDLLVTKGANRNNMSTCHNFYPQEYTGLSLKRFNYFTNKYYSLGLPVHAFVSSNNDNTFGPWPVFKGLCTIEDHRYKAIDFQMRYLIATRKIDDIIIGNSFALEDEFKEMRAVDLSKASMRIDLCENISDVEKTIIFDYPHFDRVDSSEYILRSSVTRQFANDKSIPARLVDNKYFEKGDVLIVNDNMSHYRGELEIVRKRIKNTGDRNLVGHLNDDEVMILDVLEEQNLFRLI